VCSNSNISQSSSRLLVQRSKSLPSFHQRAQDPMACTHARLLGPCYKTGRIKPHTQCCSRKCVWVGAAIASFSSTAADRPDSRTFSLTHTHIKIVRQGTPRTARSTPTTLAAGGHCRSQQPCPRHKFNSLPFQQFHELLTLFSKSFSPFPHGTCLLSVSSTYAALGEKYHPLCTPIPKNTTRRNHAMHGGLQVM